MCVNNVLKQKIWHLANYSFRNLLCCCSECTSVNEIQMKNGKIKSLVGVLLTIHVLTMIIIWGSVSQCRSLKFRNNSLFSILCCRRCIWMFLLIQIFCCRSCRTWVKLTKPLMRSLKNIYRISTPSKSMPPDFTRISITTSDVLEVSIHHYILCICPQYSISWSMIQAWVLQLPCVTLSRSLSCINTRPRVIEPDLSVTF